MPVILPSWSAGRITGMNYQPEREQTGQTIYHGNTVNNKKTITPRKKETGEQLHDG